MGMVYVSTKVILDPCCPIQGLLNVPRIIQMKPSKFASTGPEGDLSAGDCHTFNLCLLVFLYLASGYWAKQCFRI